MSNPLYNNITFLYRPLVEPDVGLELLDLSSTVVPPLVWVVSLDLLFCFCVFAGYFFLFGASFEIKEIKENLSIYFGKTIS